VDTKYPPDALAHARFVVIDLGDGCRNFRQRHRSRAGSDEPQARVEHVIELRLEGHDGAPQAKGDDQQSRRERRVQMKIEEKLAQGSSKSITLARFLEISGCWKNALHYSRASSDLPPRRDSNGARSSKQPEMSQLQCPAEAGLARLKPRAG
jgi:hypothetical protein